MSNDFSIRTIDLPLTMICTQVVFPKLEQMKLGAAGNWNVNVMADYMRDATVAQITGYFASQPLIPEINIAYPKDWLEAVKERFAPEWFLKRFPVRYVAHYAKVADLYPEFIVPKSLGRSIRIAEHRSWDTTERNDW